ncbi:uncharacterized protein LOC136091433 [Hydra vulgaris]|uniref:Uncharacterized protein LOC136091433 n=1 Tax=Hydra vulgaris TaxID=6087 RepID=A0ABM4DKM7_HYDVU
MKIRTYFFGIILWSLVIYLEIYYIVFKEAKNKTTEHAGLIFNSINNHITADEDIGENKDCVLKGIYKKVHIYEQQKISCQDHVLSKVGCAFVKKEYSYDSENNCKIVLPLEICKFSQNNYLTCNQSSCGEESIFIHIINPKSGETTIVEARGKTDNELKKFVLRYIKISIANKFSFIFLSCGKNKSKTQLLVLESHLKTQSYLKSYSERTLKLHYKQKLNINLIMIDSVSRAHFYRSLQKTTKMLNEINLNSETEVLDFEKYQAIHGHTMENVRALFTGTVFPKNYTEEMKESAGVGIDTFMSYFVNHGFHTLYQDDMCWKAQWGISMDLGFSKSWVDLFEKINKSSIQDTGLLHSNCKVLSDLGLEHVFNTEKTEKVCFNNNQHDYYYLNYIKKYYKNLHSFKPTFSYTALMVAHDSGGIRIQTIDKDLSEFVLAMSELNNTLTVIFSDHGNAYTKYVYHEIDGRYEMFHPFMFMIIPKGIKNFFDAEEMDNLRINQKRLFSLVDFHNMLFYFVKKISYQELNHVERGLLDIIPNDRNCENLPLVMPNLCICSNFYTEIKNESSLIGYLEFAVGQLNNMITNSSQAYACKRFVPLWFENVRKKKDGDFIKTSFDIYISPGLGSSNSIEKVNVLINSVESESIENFSMELIGWDRITKFAAYSKCSDASLHFRLCICDLTPTHTELAPVTIHYLKTRNFQNFYNSSRTSTTFNLESYLIQEDITVLEEESLLLITRTIKDYDEKNNLILVSVSFEAVSLSTKVYFVEVVVNNVNNLKKSVNSTCHGKLNTNSIIYICTYSKIVSNKDAFLDYFANFEEL